MPFCIYLVDFVMINWMSKVSADQSGLVKNT